MRTADTMAQRPIAESFDPTDDWAGLSDPKERRRRQNRLNQRAYRKRKQAQQQDHDLEIDPKKETDESVEPPTEIVRSPRRCIGPGPIRDLFLRFTQTAYESYALGSPTSEHLLTLSKVNVFRAFMLNCSILGIAIDDAGMDDDAISPFVQTPNPDYKNRSLLSSSPHNEQLDETHTNLPINLRPTAIQRQLPHHPWLDFFPFPKMRDNLIRAGDFDDDSLCADIMGFWDFSDESCSLLVWGEPWDPRNWEATEQFMKKWPWVMRGLPELMESTNSWRRKRGEKLIFRYV